MKIIFSRRITKQYYHWWVYGCCLLPFVSIAQQKDSSALLKKVIVTSLKKQQHFTDVTPAQSLNRETLQQLNAPSAGDAARYFSGVLVKDYGGVGGLKTVSVRSLGASHTGIIYDGLPVSDAQSGQIDLGRYSATFIQSLDLYQANPPELLQPARAFSSGAVISIRTRASYPSLQQTKTWQAGLHAGSFGLWQPFAGISLPVSRKTTISASAEAMTSKGDYPFTIENGTESENTHRQNADVRSLQGELNAVTVFNDSSLLQAKIWGYTSKRGLPGAVIFFNDRSVQQLWNKDYFMQLRYNRKLGKATSLLLSGKFNHSYTRYTDPDYLNNQGGLDNRYTQQEWYGSAAVSHHIGQSFTIAAAADIAAAKLESNLPNFAYPSRLSLWNNLSAQYVRPLWQVSGSLLWTHIDDKVQKGQPAAAKDKVTPTIALSGRLSEESPFMLRAFYKHVFRMPTFNDLYYNMIGNTGLRPEYARQYNAGITWSKKLTGVITQVNIRADGCYNTVKDKIIAVPSKNLFIWTMLNLGNVRITGVDLTTELNGKLSQQVSWFTRIAYTWQQALDVTDPAATDYKDRIPYTPDHSGSGLLSFRYRQWSAGYSFLFSGTRYVLGENNPYNELDGWSTHDVFVARSLLLGQVKATIKCEAINITDQHYDVVKNFPMPGRSFKISLLFNNL